MTEQQWQTIADRDRGDDPRMDDVQRGDRVTWIVGDLSEANPALIRIERLVPKADVPQALLEAGEFQDERPVPTGSDEPFVPSAHAGIDVCRESPHIGSRGITCAECGRLLRAMDDAPGKVGRGEREHAERYPVPTADEDVPELERVARALATSTVHSIEAAREYVRLAGMLVRPSVPTREQIAAQLEDMHARWHDQPGNMLGRDECGWEGCDFYSAAEFALIQKGTER